MPDIQVNDIVRLENELLLVSDVYANGDIYTRGGLWGATDVSQVTLVERAADTIPFQEGDLVAITDPWYESARPRERVLAVDDGVHFPAIGTVARTHRNSFGDYRWNVTIAGVGYYIDAACCTKINAENIPLEHRVKVWSDVRELLVAYFDCGDLEQACAQSNISRRGVVFQLANDYLETRTANAA